MTAMSYLPFWATFSTAGSSSSGLQPRQHRRLVELVERLPRLGRVAEVEPARARLRRMLVRQRDIAGVVRPDRQATRRTGPHGSPTGRRSRCRSRRRPASVARAMQASSVLQRLDAAIGVVIDGLVLDAVRRSPGAHSAGEMTGAVRGAAGRGRGEGGAVVAAALPSPTRRCRARNSIVSRKADRVAGSGSRTAKSSIGSGAGASQVSRTSCAAEQDLVARSRSGSRGAWAV